MLYAKQRGTEAAVYKSQKDAEAAAMARPGRRKRR